MVAAVSKSFARTFGQDLMRGEHVVGGGMNKAIPGGATGKNSAYMFRQPEGGYAVGEEAQVTGSGTSIFDPVLCELLYKWFCPPGGKVLDPFAGGSVRGIVAGVLGRSYHGIDLRAEQVAENRRQIAAIAPMANVTWEAGDSRVALANLAGPFDFVMSCPPYGSLERYSDDPSDLSAMTRADFDAAYAGIIRLSCALLAPDSFACFVVGNYRLANGFYHDLVGATVRAFESAGAGFYNDCVLVTAAGSLPIRAGAQFTATRKLGKTHQNVLVFCKGNPKKATAKCEAL